MSSAWKTVRGNTTSNNLRTCEIVITGAFFFQPELEMPEKEVGQHTRQHMVMLPWVLADFIVVHPQFGFRFLKALLNGPSHTTEPDKHT
jgi:hypothetical protein